MAMAFDPRKPTAKCSVCSSPAAVWQNQRQDGEIIYCTRCGDFEILDVIAGTIGLPFTEPKKQALASYVIRKLQKSSAPRPVLNIDFFRALEGRSLPTPAEASDNLLLWLADKVDGIPGTRWELTYSLELYASIGVVGQNDVAWIMKSLISENLIEPVRLAGQFNWTGHVTAKGWNRVEELRRAHVASKFAFFARQFDNPDLDRLFDNCLRKAVQHTGYELRQATQRAGLIDAVIEDEIRRCRFVIADLSDDNAGAYWEAGFAQGLGKDVIYICRKIDRKGELKKTHFDTNHRQTVWWDLAEPEQTATVLKAVIRNTLLGDANQSD